MVHCVSYVLRKGIDLVKTLKYETVKPFTGHKFRRCLESKQIVRSE